MAEIEKAASLSPAAPPRSGELSAKWDACVDLTTRRFVYCTLAGALGGLLLLRSPVTRWSSVAFGAGVGIGSAYTECCHILDGSPPKWTYPKASNALSSSSSSHEDHK